MGENKLQSVDQLIRQKQNKVSTKPDNNKPLSIELKPEARRLYIE